MSLDMKYFVLKPRGNSSYALASRQAMCLYALMIEKTNLELAQDLREWVRLEEQKAGGLT